ncbi:trypsin-like peptidase domain-containing protein [Corallococcus sp. M34]|uniref:trypsin-like peptidase domain-containing protein n=1 Tax=Citreicoccus inhibens TaxID=2849499 RepID=UPI001C22E58F|nr:trypsin-like peptidase domain-containing protein [Citreicoccus inhibens]MBU8898870.1 trypsin-like peptidase domain-containing protein [Citreicoccus inhibens]
MELDGSERDELVAALPGAFPSEEALRRMVLQHCGRALDMERQGDVHEWTRGLLQRAEAEGWTEALVRGAYAAAPQNARLHRFFLSYLASVQRSVPADVLARMAGVAPGTPALASWRERLAVLSRRVCRVELEGGRALGTGFLVAPDVVLTNSHVVENRLLEALRVRFDLKVLPDRSVLHAGALYPVRACLAQSPHSPADLMRPKPREATRDELDYAFLVVSGEPGGDTGPGRPRGWIPLSRARAAFAPGSRALVLQHPDGRPMQVALETFQGVNPGRTRVTYRTTTHPGSSGSPCFTQDLELVALHHSGDPRSEHGAEDDEGIPLDTIHASLSPDARRRLGWE